MSRYVQQPSENMPHDTAQIIHHYVKTFVNDDPDDLDTAVNAYLLSLEGLPATPIIKSIDYEMIFDSAPAKEILYSSQIHYLLVD